MKVKKKPTPKTKQKSIKASAKKKASAMNTMRSISMVKNILFKPERYRYIKKEIKKENKSNGCVFCQAASKVDFETLCVYKSKHSMVVLNKFPYNSGHILVLPQSHYGDLFKLSDEQYLDLMATLRFASLAVTEVCGAAAFNLGMNHGSCAGAGIPEHLHFHVIPRWAGDLNFFPLIAQTKVVIETLEQTYEKYLSYFNSKVSL